MCSQTAQVTTFGARFRSTRLAKGYTQDDLADLLGVTKSAVSAWENDRETPAFDKLGPIHRALDASVDELLFGAPTVGDAVRDVRATYYPEPPPIDQARTPEERKLLRLFRTLTDAQRRGLLALLGKGEA